MIQFDPFEKQRDGERVAESVGMSALDRRFCRTEYLLENTIPALDGGLAFATAVPEKIVWMRVRETAQGADRNRRQRTVHGGAGLLRVQEQFAVFQSRTFETRGVLHPKTRVAEQQYHCAGLRAKRTPVRNLISGSQDPFDIGVLKRKRRSLRHLRGFERRCGIGVDPSRLQTESQESAEVLQPFYCGEWGVRPAVAKSPERVHVELLEKMEALCLAERQELALEELAAFPNRGLRQVPRDGVFEVSCHRVFDSRDVWLDDAHLTSSLPAVDNRGSGAPLPCVERSLDPFATQGTLNPDAAFAASPAASLASMGAASCVPTPESQTAGRHCSIVPEFASVVSASFLPASAVSAGSIDSIGLESLVVLAQRRQRSSESHPLRHPPSLTPRVFFHRRELWPSQSAAYE